ncbi:hypothetical protein UlMin_024363 [Ulmus minor]
MLLFLQKIKLVKHVTRLFCTFTSSQQSHNSIKELHAHLIRTHLHKDTFLISEVIRFYARSPSNLDKAHFVFDQIERPSLFVWNHMIRGLSQSDEPSQAIHFYCRMYGQGLIGDNLSFIFVLKACARVSDVLHGQKVHVGVIKLGFQSFVYVANGLIHMYACSGDLGSAQKVFDEMCERDLVSWNSLICGYSKWNRFKEVLGLFEAMRAANMGADSVTMMKVIFACTSLGEYELAGSFVKYIEENDIRVNVYLGNTIIDMYGRCGLVNLAREVFDKIPERNIVSWNAMIMGDVISWTTMITGYSQTNQHDEALRLFQEMMAAKIKPDEVTVATVLSACAHLGSLDIGEAVHRFIKNHRVKADVCVGNALIDMYCKCGVGEKALEVFLEMKAKDCVSWTSVISGLAVNGFAYSALDLFLQMLREGIRPTHGTFVGILLACSHTGLVDKGLKYFDSMEKVHGLKPEMKHYGCVVDLLSRSGHLEKAYEFINKMPVVPDVVIWRILLNACKLYGNVALAEVVTNKLLEVDPYNSGNYVLSSNTYAGIDRWDDVVKMRKMMGGSNVQKPFGYSSIEVDSLISSYSQDHLMNKL